MTRGPGTHVVAGLLAAAAVAAAGCAPPSDAALAPPAAAPAPPAAVPGARPAAAAPAPTRSAPTRLRIPAIDLDSTLVPLGLRADGTMDVPPAAFPAGWYSGGPTPGETGPAVIAGHVDWGGRAGVFARLRRLAPGDEVVVTRADRTTLVFEVSRVTRFRKDGFPTDLVYGDIDHAGLRLITCGGSFDRAAHSYIDNVVVFARQVGAARPPHGSTGPAGNGR